MVPHEVFDHVPQKGGIPQLRIGPKIVRNDLRGYTPSMIGKKDFGVTAYS